MNDLRKLHNKTLVTCANDQEILSKKDSFKILIGLMTETFDTWMYNQDGGLQY